MAVTPGEAGASTAAAAAVQRRLAAEVLRKLRLAAESEDKDDRDIVAAEVFADVTGELNSAARGGCWDSAGGRLALHTASALRILPRTLPCLAAPALPGPTPAAPLLPAGRRQHRGAVPPLVRGPGAPLLPELGGI